jgi:hypothetical protein
VTLLTGLRGVPDLDVSQNIHCPGWTFSWFIFSRSP